MKRLVITLGMHRSGTSLLSAALECLNVDYGSELMDPAPDNPKGFWEDRTLVALNEGLYEAMGVTSSSLGIDCSSLTDSARWRFQLRIARWLKGRLAGDGVLGLKDPRLPRLMDVWMPVLRRLGVDFCLLIPLRNPLSVAASLTARDGFSTAKGLLLWYEHMVKALQFARGRRFLIVDYDHFLCDPAESLSLIADHFDLSLDLSMLERFQQQVLDPGLRHAVYDLEDLRSHPDGFLPLIQLYELLHRASIRRGTAKSELDDGLWCRIEERFADLRPLLRQCGRWDMELWSTARFHQVQEEGYSVALRNAEGALLQAERALQHCNEDRIRRETELTSWIATLESMTRSNQEDRGRREAELTDWIQTLEDTIRSGQEDRARRETELTSWIATLESMTHSGQEDRGRREAELTAWIQTLEDTIRSSQEDRARREAELTAWVAALENATRSGQEARALRENELTAWVATLEGTIRRIQEDRGRRENELTSWVATLEGTIRRIQEDKSRREIELTTWIETLEGTIRAEQEGRAGAEAWLEGQLREAQRRAGVLEVELDRMRFSLTWRCTSPLRRARAWLVRRQVS